MDKTAGKEQRTFELQLLVPEINNALAAILGNAQLLLLKQAVTPEGKANLEAIRRNSLRIHELLSSGIAPGNPPPVLNPMSGGRRK